MDSEKKMKIVISPVVQEQIDEILKNGTDEEIEELQNTLDSFKEQVERGELPEGSEPVDMDQLMEDEPDVAEALMAGIRMVEAEAGIDPELSGAAMFFAEAKDDPENVERKEQFTQLYGWLMELQEIRVRHKSMKAALAVALSHSSLSLKSKPIVDILGSECVEELEREAEDEMAKRAN